MELLVLLHGYGDDPARLAALAPELGLPPSVRVLVPTGSHQGDHGPAWVPAEPTPAELEAALDRLTGMIAAEGAGAASTVVGGFSQGGAIALALGLRAGADRWRPAAVFGLAAYLFAPDLVEYDLGLAPSLPVLLVHGEDDEAVPPAQGRSAARVLERAGGPVELREHPGIGHEPSPVFAEDVRHWWTGLRPAPA